MFQGFCQLESDVPVLDLVQGATGPANATSLPTYRVYGPDGFLTGQSGSMAYRDTAAITGATNASPVEVTSANHGLTSGARVTVSGVAGNTGANGTFVVAVTGDDTFTLTGSTGTGTYTSGGVWNVTGLYQASLTCSAANGYAAGETYTLLVSGATAGGDYGATHTFTVT